MLFEQLDALGWHESRPEGEIGTTHLVERRGAAWARAARPRTVDVDLLSAESVHPRTQGVARALGIVDTLESKHVDVEPMRGVPVVDVDDHMSEVGLRISDPAYKAGSWTRRWTANMRPTNS